MKPSIALFLLVLTQGFTISMAQKINGVCTVAPDFEVTSNHIEPIVNLGANWIAVIPYAFCSSEQPQVVFDHDRQWIGERSEGIIQTICLAKESGLKVMLKPHLWVMGEGWAGGLEFDHEKDLTRWKKSYSTYLTHFARLSDSLEVDMISIGTELKQLSRHEGYWNDLICSVRNVYGGPLTYSANWDNYDKIAFWDELDMIGIDAYFPISDSKTPTKSDVVNSFQALVHRLGRFSMQHGKPIVFTEFGFRSIDQCANGHWVGDYESAQVNFECQRSAYSGIFEAFWGQSWFAGGFIWKWFFDHRTSGGDSDDKFTPQNKPAEKVIRDFFNH